MNIDTIFVTGNFTLYMIHRSYLGAETAALGVISLCPEYPEAICSTRIPRYGRGPHKKNTKNKKKLFIMIMSVLILVRISR